MENFFLEPSFSQKSYSPTFLPIPENQRFALAQSGLSVDEILHQEPQTLSKLTNLPLQESEEVINVCRRLFPRQDEEIRSSKPLQLLPSDSVLDLLKDFEVNPLKTPVTTFCERVDQILGGGFQIGQSTELFGYPGSGKTQMCHQLAVSVQIPQNLGGCAGECIYIDTEGGFSVERISEMANATISHFDQMSQATPHQDHELTLESILSHIHYFRATCASEQLAIFRQLPSILSSNQRIRLVIVDSIAFHFRFGFNERKERSRVLFEMAQNLNLLCERFCVAVVWVNQVAMKRSEFAMEAKPALGENWGHICVDRLQFRLDGTNRFAQLLKSSHMKNDSAPFMIFKEGIRDVGWIGDDSSPSSQFDEQDSSQFWNSQPTTDDFCLEDVLDVDEDHE